MKFVIITRKKLMFLLAILVVTLVAVIGSVNIFADNERLLPIYCVETDKKQVAISFDVDLGNSKRVQNNIW